MGPALYTYTYMCVDSFPGGGGHTSRVFMQCSRDGIIPDILVELSIAPGICPVNPNQLQAQIPIRPNAVNPPPPGRGRMLAVDVRAGSATATRTHPSPGPDIMHVAVMYPTLVTRVVREGCVFIRKGPRLLFGLRASHQPVRAQTGSGIVQKKSQKVKS